jgi:hypothetical protein
MDNIDIDKMLDDLCDLDNRLEELKYKKQFIPGYVDARHNSKRNNKEPKKSEWRETWR